MSTKQNHYDEEFKRTLVELHVGDKSQNALCKEYVVSKSTLSRLLMGKNSPRGYHTSYYHAYFR